MRNPFAPALPILQSLAESVMEDTATIRVPGNRVDKPGGGWEYTSETTASYPCRIGPLSDKSVERLTEGRMDFTGLEELNTSLSSPPLTANDTVSVLSTRFGTERRFTIEGVAPLGTNAVQRTAIVKAV